jgi:ribosome-associated heat shock protein Hsp15
VADREETRRLDLWLYYARFAKSRSMAAELARKGAVRINRQKMTAASKPVRIGDVLTLKISNQVSVVKVLELGLRRGPAPEAQMLYENLLEEQQNTR